MTKFLLSLAAIFFASNYATAQARMEIFLKDKKCDILGYAMDPDGTGNKQSISIIGNMQNATAMLQMSYYSAGAIKPVQLFISAPNAENTLITLSDVVVYSIKENLTSYNNGACLISSAGNPVTEIKCKFTKIITEQNSNVKEPVIGLVKTVEDPLNLTKKEQKWEMQTDPALKGLTGEVIMQIPDGLAFNTHMEFFEAGDTKKQVASWFNNNSAKLMPGLYDIRVDGHYFIKNVPVEQGKQTRLKMGVLHWSGYTGVTLEDASHQRFSYAPPFKIVLPAGTYTIVGRKQMPNTFEIIDGKLTEF